MKSILLFITIFAITLVGCQQQAASESEALTPAGQAAVSNTETPSPEAPTETSTIAPTATHTPPPTFTPVPTNTKIPQNTSSNTSRANATINEANSSTDNTCMVRTDLPTYTVVAGDTLFKIASRADMTISQLADFNCLENVNIIEVGQQLRVTKTIAQVANGGEIPDNDDSDEIIFTDLVPEGTIAVSPWLAQANNNHYVVRNDLELSIWWTGMPTDRRLIQVDFMYVDDHYTVQPILIGTDSDLSDGAMIQWATLEGIQGYIYAVGRIPGQTHQWMQSQYTHITSIEPNLGERIGPRGALSADPNLQADTPQDWSHYIVEAGDTITIRWTGVDPDEFIQIRSNEFQYLPDSGVAQILGRDTNPADGMDVIWIVPENASGRIQAEGDIGNSSVIYSPQIHVRTPSSTISGCEFIPRSLDGSVPVYTNPDLNSERVSFIAVGQPFSITEKGGHWSGDFGATGTFYHLDLGHMTAWVQDIRGELQGNCSNIPIVVTDPPQDNTCRLSISHRTGIVSDPDDPFNTTIGWVAAGITQYPNASRPDISYWRIRTDSGLEGWIQGVVAGNCDAIPIMSPPFLPSDTCRIKVAKHTEIVNVPQGTGRTVLGYLDAGTVVFLTTGIPELGVYGFNYNDETGWIYGTPLGDCSNLPELGSN